MVLPNLLQHQCCLGFVWANHTTFYLFIKNRDNKEDLFENICPLHHLLIIIVWRHWIYQKKFVRYILSSMCLWLCLCTSLSFMQYIGLSIISWTISIFDGGENIVLLQIIIIESKYETMIYAVSNAFSWMKIVFWFKCHQSLFLNG